MLPFAVNHFTGSRDFIRALRYWARGAAPAAAAAAQLRPGATGFKLSEYGLMPINRQEAVRNGDKYQNREVRRLSSAHSCWPFAKRNCASLKSTGWMYMTLGIPVARGGSYESG